MQQGILLKNVGQNRAKVVILPILVKSVKGREKLVKVISGGMPIYNTIVAKKTIKTLGSGGHSSVDHRKITTPQ